MNKSWGHVADEKCQVNSLSGSIEAELGADVDLESATKRVASQLEKGHVFEVVKKPEVQEAAAIPEAVMSPLRASLGPAPGWQEVLMSMCCRKQQGELQKKIGKLGV